GSQVQVLYGPLQNFLIENFQTEPFSMQNAAKGDRARAEVAWYVKKRTADKAMDSNETGEWRHRGDAPF
ncbi:MAG: hypothetical protein WAK12_06910, partial [Acidimicrobiales bacterium]